MQAEILLEKATSLSIRKARPYIFTIENHNESYNIWSKFGLKDKILVHIDAHMDFAWFTDVNPLTLLDTHSIKELENLVRNTKVWNPSPNPKDVRPNIGNYIYSAIRDGIVTKFYWVVPDDFLRSEKRRKFWKKIITNIAKNIPGHRASVILDDKRIVTRFCQAEVTVCDLQGLPDITDEVLLDIDTDFMLTDFRTQDSTASLQIKKSPPWLWPEDLVGILKKKQIRPECATIAYSVEGYFTPLEFKYLGDELAILLSDKPFDDNVKKAMEFRKKAMVNKYRGLLDEAIECLNSALALSPEEPSCYYNLALLQYSKGQYEKAAQYYERAVHFDGQYRTRYNNLGEVYGQLGRYKEMEAEYRKILVLDPDNSYAHSGRGEVLFIKKRLKEAEEELEKAISFEPKNSRARYLLSTIFMKKKLYQEAIFMLKELIENDIGYVNAYSALGRLYTKQGLVDEAIRNYRCVIRLGFCDTALYIRLGLLYLKKTAYPKAIKSFIQAGRLFPLEIVDYIKSYFKRLRLS
jgi:tetratricopeptide (TPR) repeat protein